MFPTDWLQRQQRRCLRGGGQCWNVTQPLASSYWGEIHLNPECSHPLCKNTQNNYPSPYTIYWASCPIYIALTQTGKTNKNKTYNRWMVSLGWITCAQRFQSILLHDIFKRTESVQIQWTPVRGGYGGLENSDWKRLCQQQLCDPHECNNGTHRIHPESTNDNVLLKTYLAPANLIVCAERWGLLLLLLVTA